MDSDRPSTRRRRSRSFGSPTRAGPDLAGTFGPDRRRLQRLIRSNAPEAAEAVRASKHTVEQRRASVPEVTYPAELPFAERIDDIKEAMGQSQVVVVCGETGSGKSTQLPKLCLDLGMGVEGLIGHTQPRRLAARSVADRVAQELGVSLGNEVGSKIRFSDQTSDRTLVKVMTDGMLLAESRSDRLLKQYSAIIVDEAHERSLNIDFLLGILSRVLPKRRDLSLLITSATIDPERFAEHFAAVLRRPVPIIEVSGRTFPVETVYREPVDDEGRALELSDAIADAAEHLAVKDGFGPAGDVLVFLPGEREIREAARSLRRACEASRLLAGTEIVPLYARLSFAEQQRVFRRAPHRRIVLATNVAETSLTVPGIRYVIDSGLARINRYSPRRRVQSLQIEPISRASARQRAGRCGRTEPGTCVRLYSEDDHDRRDEFTPPEIQRTNLAGVILQMRSLRLGDPREFPFVEPPDARRIGEAYETLFELGAVDDRQRLTKLGEQMARLPIDPRLARILISAHEEGVLPEAMIIASALEVQDPRERPADARDAADAKHARFADGGSDFVTLLNLWDHYHREKERLSRSQLKKQCIAEFINSVRMNEWSETYRQLREICRGLGWRLRHRAAELDRDALHRSILTGCLTTVGKRHDQGGFVSPHAGVFHIHPGSAVKLKGTGWLVAAELVRTTRLYARLCARIEGAWVEELAPHLIQREHTDAAYVPEQGRVEAKAKITLGRVEIARDRMVDYGSVDREHARRIFIEQGLVEGQLRTDAPFERHNTELLGHLAEREAKLRTTQRPSDEALHAFFDQRLASDISSARAFDRWRRRAERDEPALLHMTPEAIGCDTSEPVDPRSVPDAVPVGVDGSAHLTYRLEPGSDQDGIEARLSVTDAARAAPGAFEWLVPGWLREKIGAIVRGLPRSVRRQFDIAEMTDLVARAIGDAEGDLHARIADEVSRITGLQVSREMCRAVPLPAHLEMTGVLIDTDEGELVRTKDFASLIAAAREREAAARKDAGRAPVVQAWPRSEPRIEPPLALVDAVQGVRLLETGDPTTASVLHWFGCRRLVGITLSRPLAPLLKHTPHADRLGVHLATVTGAQPLVDEVAALVPEVDRAADAQAPSTADELNSLTQAMLDQLGDRSTRVVALLAQIMDARQRVLSMLDSVPVTGDHARRDVEFQINQLVHAAAFRRGRWGVLARLPAYLKGASARLERLRGDGIARDLEAMRRVTPHWARCIERARIHASTGRESPALDRYRWMIEEYRLTLFASQLALRKAASERLLARVWDDVERDG